MYGRISWKKSCGGKQFTDAENAKLADEYKKFQKAADIQRIAHRKKFQIGTQI